MFTYDAAGLAMLESASSPDRLSTYKAAGGGDRNRAIELYVWNTAISAAFFGALQALEVGLRNAVHREMSAAYGTAWHDDPIIARIDPKLARSISEAKAAVLKQQRTLTTGRFIASLSLGFWTRLYGPGPGGNYDNYFWRRALHRTFSRPGAPPLTRGYLAAELNRARILRNRIAHLEPIFNRNLADEFTRVRNLADWLYPGLGDWIEHHSRCSSLLADRPRPRQMM